MSAVPKCENCSFKHYAERRPDSLLARLWRWHTGWCPGWKAYQKWLAGKDLREFETAGSEQNIGGGPQ